MDLKPTLKFTNSLDVLYIENNKILRESNRRLFGNFFARVDVAKNGKQGFELYQNYYKNNQKYYDLIIIDIPNMDGLKISKEIYKLQAEQDIILITANNEIDFFLKAINMGYSDIVLKPFGKKKMVKTFHKVCQNIYSRKFVLEHDYYHCRSKSDRLVNNRGDDYFMGQVEELVDRDLSELVSLHNEMDKALGDILMNDFNMDILKNNLPKLSNLFNQYALVLSFYTFFDAISRRMSIFSDTISDVDSLEEQKDRYSDIFTLLESFLFVLKSWQTELATCDRHKIDYYNSAIINDMTTISNMWSMNCIKEKDKLIPH